MALSVMAATAVSSALLMPRVWFSEPYLRVDVEESEARHFSPGSYGMWDGRIRKVVRIERPKDWSVSTVTLVLADGVHEQRDPWDIEEGQFMSILRKLPSAQGTMKIAWLEDDFPPRPNPRWTRS